MTIVAHQQPQQGQHFTIYTRKNQYIVGDVVEVTDENGNILGEAECLERCEADPQWIRQPYSDPRRVTPLPKRNYGCGYYKFVFEREE